MEVDSDSDDGIVLINHRNYTKMVSTMIMKGRQ